NGATHQPDATRDGPAAADPPPKPLGLPLRVEPIPAELCERRQWVCWRYALKADKQGVKKWTKVPVNPRNGYNAASDNPATWDSFEAAVAFHQGHPTSTDGIGYVFCENDPYAGVDLDKSLDPQTGEMLPWAQPLAAALATYTEVSPSGS